LNFSPFQMSHEIIESPPVRDGTISGPFTPERIPNVRIVTYTEWTEEFTRIEKIFAPIANFDKEIDISFIASEAAAGNYPDIAIKVFCRVLCEVDRRILTPRIGRAITALIQRLKADTKIVNAMLEEFIPSTISTKDESDYYASYQHAADSSTLHPAKLSRRMVHLFDEQKGFCQITWIPGLPEEIATMFVLASRSIAPTLDFDLRSSQSVRERFKVFCRSFCDGYQYARFLPCGESPHNRDWTRRLYLDFIKEARLSGRMYPHIAYTHEVLNIEDIFDLCVQICDHVASYSDDIQSLAPTRRLSRYDARALLNAISFVILKLAPCALTRTIEEVLDDAIQTKPSDVKRFVQEIYREDNPVCAPDLTLGMFHAALWIYFIAEDDIQPEVDNIFRMVDPNCSESQDDSYRSVLHAAMMRYSGVPELDPNEQIAQEGLNPQAGEEEQNENTQVLQ